MRSTGSRLVVPAAVCFVLLQAPLNSAFLLTAPQLTTLSPLVISEAEKVFDYTHTFDEERNVALSSEAAAYPPHFRVPLTLRLPQAVPWLRVADISLFPSSPALPPIPASAVVVKAAKRQFTLIRGIKYADSNVCELLQRSPPSSFQVALDKYDWVRTSNDERELDLDLYFTASGFNIDTWTPSTLPEDTPSLGARPAASETSPPSSLGGIGGDMLDQPGGFGAPPLDPSKYSVGGIHFTAEVSGAIPVAEATRLATTEELETLCTQRTPDHFTCDSLRSSARNIKEHVYHASKFNKDLILRADTHALDMGFVPAKNLRSVSLDFTHLAHTRPDSWWRDSDFFIEVRTKLANVLPPDLSMRLLRRGFGSPQVPEPVALSPRIGLEPPELKNQRESLRVDCHGEIVDPARSPFAMFAASYEANSFWEAQRLKPQGTSKARKPPPTLHPFVHPPKIEADQSLIRPLIDSHTPVESWQLFSINDQIREQLRQHPWRGHMLLVIFLYTHHDVDMSLHLRILPVPSKALAVAAPLLTSKSSFPRLMDLLNLGLAFATACVALEVLVKILNSSTSGPKRPYSALAREVYF